MKDLSLGGVMIRARLKKLQEEFNKKMTSLMNRGGNRSDRPTGAYDMAYIKSDLNWPI